MKKLVINLLKNEIFLTITTVVLVFVLSQLFIELIINPNKKYKSLKARIGYKLAMYSCYYCNPYRFDKEQNVRNLEEYSEASKEVRKIGAELAAYIGTVPAFRFKKRKKLREVRDSLIGISNGFYQYPNYCPIKDNKVCEKRIKEILKLN